MYHGRKYGWHSIESDLKNSCSSDYFCYTKSRAIKSAAQLKAAGAKDILVSKVTYKRGKRLFLDYGLK